MNFYPAFRDRVMMLRLGISLFFSSFLLFFLNKAYAIPPPQAGNYLVIPPVNGGSWAYVRDNLGNNPNEDVYLSYNSGWNRHLSGSASVRSIHYTGDYPYGWIYRMERNTIYIGAGGFSFNGTGGMMLDGGFLTSLVGAIKFKFNSGFIQLSNCIHDNGNIKIGLDITYGAGGVVYLEGSQSNTFSGVINIQWSNILSLRKTNGAIAVSGSMNIKSGAKVVSHRSGQIAHHVNVNLESRGSEPASQLILENGVQEKFNKLTIDGRGIVEFKGFSKLILDELNVGVWDELTIVGWENNKDLFLVRKTSTHVKRSLGNIIFQGQRGRVHLEDYNKDYWELTTAPEPTTTGAIIGVIIAGISIRCNRLKKRRRSLSASVPI